MRHLLCQDVIFHRISCTIYSEIQRQALSYGHGQMEQNKFVTMKNLQERDNLIPNRNDNDLFVKMPSPDTEIRGKILMSMG